MSSSRCAGLCTNTAPAIMRMPNDSGFAPITAGGGRSAYPHACHMCSACEQMPFADNSLGADPTASPVDCTDGTPRFSTVDITDAISSSAGSPFRSTVMDMLVSNTGLTVVYEPESGFPIAE